MMLRLLLLLLLFLIAGARASAQVEEVFVFPDPSVHIEGIAYDPYDSSFYMGSVNTGTVYRLRRGRLDTVFTPNAGNRWSVLGMMVQPGTRKLWITRACLRESADTNRAGMSELRVIDFSNGAQQGWPVAREGRQIILNDLAFGDGIVWVSDSGKPGGMWMLAPRSAYLQPAPINGPRSPQGIVPLDHTLYIADWSRGIYHYIPGDTISQYVRIALPPDSKRLFIDGLLPYGDNSFLAICNGSDKRIVALEPQGDSLAARTIVRLDNPRYNEPTLGVRVGPWLYFIANSQWESYADPKKRTAAIVARVRVE